jgi:hypothetical protein
MGIHMAETNRAKAIRQKKEDLRISIRETKRMCEEAIKRVPRTVIDGDHREAVAWKRAAEEVNEFKGRQAKHPSKNATAKQLSRFAERERQRLSYLQTGRNV